MGVAIAMFMYMDQRKAALNKNGNTNLSMTLHMMVHMSLRQCYEVEVSLHIADRNPTKAGPVDFARWLPGSGCLRVRGRTALRLFRISGHSFQEGPSTQY